MGEQLVRLRETLERLASGDYPLYIAFSGGVDSSLLVKYACDLGLDVYAITFQNPMMPGTEIVRACTQAQSYGARHKVMEMNPLARPEVRNNEPSRCYHCKRLMFEQLRSFAGPEPPVLDGSNADDLQAYRPGLRALKDLQIISPLMELSLFKQDIRAMAREIGLDVAERPASPCLATRFPYGTVLTETELDRCARAEERLRSMGFDTLRVRVHEDLTRIEVPVAQMKRILEQSGEIREAMTSLGYRYVTLDLEGFRSGSFDWQVEKREN